jgi:hypothetical protein
VISVLGEERLDDEEGLFLSSLEELAEDEVDEGEEIFAGGIFGKGQLMREDSLEQVEDGDLSDGEEQRRSSSAEVQGRR